MVKLIRSVKFIFFLEVPHKWALLYSIYYLFTELFWSVKVAFCIGFLKNIKYSRFYSHFRNIKIYRVGTKNPILESYFYQNSGTVFKYLLVEKSYKFFKRYIYTKHVYFLILGFSNLPAIFYTVFIIILSGFLYFWNTLMSVYISILIDPNLVTLVPWYGVYIYLDFFLNTNFLCYEDSNLISSFYTTYIFFSTSSTGISITDIIQQLFYIKDTLDRFFFNVVYTFVYKFNCYISLIHYFTFTLENISNSISYYYQYITVTIAYEFSNDTDYALLLLSNLVIYSPLYLVGLLIWIPITFAVLQIDLLIETLNYFSLNIETLSIFIYNGLCIVFYFILPFFLIAIGFTVFFYFYLIKIFISIIPTIARVFYTPLKYFLVASGAPIKFVWNKLAIVYIQVVYLFFILFASILIMYLLYILLYKCFFFLDLGNVFKDPRELYPRTYYTIKNAQERDLYINRKIYIPKDKRKVIKVVPGPHTIMRPLRKIVPLDTRMDMSYTLKGYYRHTLQHVYAIIYNFYLKPELESAFHIKFNKGYNLGYLSTKDRYYYSQEEFKVLLDKIETFQYKMENALYKGFIKRLYYFFSYRTGLSKCFLLIPFWYNYYKKWENPRYVYIVKKAPYKTVVFDRPLINTVDSDIKKIKRSLLLKGINKPIPIVKDYITALNNSVIGLESLTNNYQKNKVFSFSSVFLYYLNGKQSSTSIKHLTVHPLYKLIAIYRYNILYNFRKKNKNDLFFQTVFTESYDITEVSKEFTSLHRKSLERDFIYMYSLADIFLSKLDSFENMKKSTYSNFNFEGGSKLALNSSSPNIWTTWELLGSSDYVRIKTLLNLYREGIFENITLNRKSKVAKRYFSLDYDFNFNEEDLLKLYKSWLKYGIQFFLKKPQYDDVIKRGVLEAKLVNPEYSSRYINILIKDFTKTKDLGFIYKYLRLLLNLYLKRVDSIPLSYLRWNNLLKAIQKRDLLHNTAVTFLSENEPLSGTGLRTWVYFNKHKKVCIDQTLYICDVKAYGKPTLESILQRVKEPLLTEDTYNTDLFPGLGFTTDFSVAHDKADTYYTLMENLVYEPLFESDDEIDTVIYLDKRNWPIVGSMIAPFLVFAHKPNRILTSGLSCYHMYTKGSSSIFLTPRLWRWYNWFSLFLGISPFWSPDALIFIGINNTRDLLRLRLDKTENLPKEVSFQSFLSKSLVAGIEYGSLGYGEINIRRSFKIFSKKGLTLNSYQYKLFTKLFWEIHKDIYYKSKLIENIPIEKNYIREKKNLIYFLCKFDIPNFLDRLSILYRELKLKSIYFYKFYIVHIIEILYAILHLELFFIFWLTLQPVYKTGFDHRPPVLRELYLINELFWLNTYFWSIVIIFVSFKYFYWEHYFIKSIAFEDLYLKNLSKTEQEYLFFKKKILKKRIKDTLEDIQEEDAMLGLPTEYEEGWNDAARKRDAWLDKNGYGKWL